MNIQVDIVKKKTRPVFIWARPTKRENDFMCQFRNVFEFVTRHKYVVHSQICHKGAGGVICIFDCLILLQVMAEHQFAL